MRLLTHNMLCCTVKNCGNGFPLTIKAAEKDVEESEFNVDFMRNFMDKIDWSALVKAVQQAGIEGFAVPEEMPENVREDENMLQALHNILVDTRILDGELTCPSCERVFYIKQGIPNMVLHQDEI